MYNYVFNLCAEVRFYFNLSVKVFAELLSKSGPAILFAEYVLSAKAYEKRFEVCVIVISELDYLLAGGT